MHIGLAGSCRGDHRVSGTAFDTLRNYSSDDVFIVVVVIAVVLLLLWFVFVQGILNLQLMGNVQGEAWMRVVCWVATGRTQK